MGDTVTTLIGLALAFGGLYARRFVHARLPSGVLPSAPDSWSRRFVSDLWKWVVGALLVAFVLVVERRSLGSVGVQPLPPVQFGGWIVGGFAGTVVLASVVRAVYERYDLEYPREFGTEHAARPTAAYLFTALTAGVTESLLFQAYPIERLTALTGSLTVAVVLAWLAFAVAHYPGDVFSLEETVYIGVPALALTVLYALSGSIFVVIVVHTAANAISFLSAAREVADESGATAGG
jgi:membrane protease YdiL (CAAX protease family)